MGLPLQTSHWHGTRTFVDADGDAVDFTLYAALIFGLLLGGPATDGGVLEATLAATDSLLLPAVPTLPMLNLTRTANDGLFPEAAQEARKKRPISEIAAAQELKKMGVIVTSGARYMDAGAHKGL
jgi:hypothetical protein